MLAQPQPKRLACTHCTKTKRKCSKQRPACQRCVDKGFVCRYPAPRIKPPYDLVFSEDGTYTALGNGDPPSHSGDIRAVVESTPVFLPGEGDSALARQLQEPWFLSPSSWRIDHKGMLNAEIYFVDDTLTWFINKVRGWLGHWTSHASTPFLHATLYRTDLPEPIQDAFAALCAYQSKSPATERVVLYIVERHAQRLLEQQSLYAGDPLLVYCIICLFDGDIRARSRAEQQIATLTTWAKQLWQSAGLAVAANAAQGPSATHDSQDIPGTSLRADGTVSSVWQAWCFSESVRRTYVTATLVTAAFLTLKQGWAPCPGGITFTPGEGLWAATSAFSWWRQVSKSRVGPLQCVNARELHASSAPSDVDEFTHAVMAVSFGLDEFNQWQDKAALVMS
ncbi:hypothetical protein PWT90_00360 [Aphanocladium album]|nr:hypothetical protein PWT90_00360 [Aphanocladium album]